METTKKRISISLTQEDDRIINGMKKYYEQSATAVIRKALFHFVLNPPKEIFDELKINLCMNKSEK